MNINEYVKMASRTRANLENHQLDELHMILGIFTESGELADVYKKNMAYGKELDHINIQEEISDILWYIANLCDISGYDLENIMEVNIKKLKARYPQKFTNQNANERNLDKERKILEELGSKL